MQNSTYTSGQTDASELPPLSVLYFHTCPSSSTPSHASAFWTSLTGRTITIHTTPCRCSPVRSLHVVQLRVSLTAHFASSSSHPIINKTANHLCCDCAQAFQSRALIRPLPLIGTTSPTSATSTILQSPPTCLLVLTRAYTRALCQLWPRIRRCGPVGVFAPRTSRTHLA